MLSYETGYFCVMRLDKFLCECNIGTRSEVKKLISKRVVSVNGLIVKSPDFHVDENQDEIKVQDKIIAYKKYTYIMLNKPSGIITASRDKHAETVMDLIKPLPARDLFAVGRLDKDTTGLLLICNDGQLSHKLLSPKYHVDKKYIVSLKENITDEAIKLLEAGVDIGDEELTLPASVNKFCDTKIELTIHEGRYHQVKRMLEAVNNEVIGLHRSTFGALVLDDDLKPGEWRELDQNEIDSLIF